MSFLKRPVALVALLACVAALSLSACGSKSNNNSSGGNTETHGLVHGTVGFAAHAGLAFGAFKIFIYNPYKQHKLSLHHPFTLAKAAAAGAFAYHEVKKAAQEIQQTPKLHVLATPFTKLSTALAGVASLSGIKNLISGNGNGISTIQNDISSASSQASSLGNPIKAATSGFNF